MPTIDLRELALDSAVLVMVPRRICERHRAIPVTVAGKVLIVAMAEPSDVVALAVMASVATLPPWLLPWEEQTDFPLVVGRGWEDFEPYEDGAPIPVVRGFRAGQHIDVFLHAREVEPGGVGPRVEPRVGPRRLALRRR